MIDLKEALATFLCKCTISGLKQRETNLKNLVCLFHCMPSEHKRWIFILNWVLMICYLYLLFPMQSIKFSHFGRVPLGVVGFVRLLCGIMPSYRVIPMQVSFIAIWGSLFGECAILRVKAQ